MPAKILESSESLKGHRMVTVRTDRGEEYVIDADQAVIALAETFSEYDNEKRFGWSLGAPWFEAEFKHLRLSAFPNGERSDG